MKVNHDALTKLFTGHIHYINNKAGNAYGETWRKLLKNNIGWPTGTVNNVSVVTALEIHELGDDVVATQGPISTN